MIRNYVGITGFMSRAEIDACLDALPTGLTLMCGVLVSAKTLRGEKTRWHRRYPIIDDIEGIFVTDSRCLNLVHYSSETAPGFGVVELLRMYGGENCNGFQFNGSWPIPYALSTLLGDHVVLQFRPGVSSIESLTEHVAAVRAASLHILIDGSGGKGIPRDWHSAGKTINALRDVLPEHVRYGVAGGLCAESLPLAARPMIRERRLSIDAEGRLRDGDEGGTLNLDKARAYLKAAGEVML